MEIENVSLIKDQKKKNFYSFNENRNNNNNNYANTKLILSDGIFRTKIQGKYNFFFNKDLSSEKNNRFIFPNCKIISSLFTKDNINQAFTQSILYKNNIKEIQKYNNNDINKINNNEIHAEAHLNNKNNIKENNNLNSFLINYKIYNIKENSIFYIKLYNKYIKYFPIFTNLSDFEKLICYNPLIENNPNFEAISPNFCHETFFIKNYNISPEKLEILKDKYVKHLYTKRNIISVEEIFKYIFEEIKINLSCINVQSPFDNDLKYCSNLINNINEIIDYILIDKNNKENIFLNINQHQEITKSNEKKNINGISKIENINNFEIKNNKNENNYCLDNNNKLIKNFVLKDINSKVIENNFFENNNMVENINMNSDKEKENNEKKNILEKENDIKGKININDEKNKKEIFTCPYCSKIFSSHCGLGGHMSKRHPKNISK